MKTLNLLSSRRWAGWVLATSLAIAPFGAHAQLFPFPPKKPAPPSAAPRTDRERADADARARFLKLNFFREGSGMHLVPGLTAFDAGSGMLNILHTRFGVNVHEGQAVGLFKEDFRGMKVGVLGCVACHSGFAAGQFIIGLGNKNIDVGKIGLDGHGAQSAWMNLNRFRLDPEQLRSAQEAVNFAARLKDSRYHNLTQGLVPTSMVRSWFYDQAGLPLPADLPRGAIKIPQLWGYGPKREVGQFCDGGGDGSRPGWAVAVELAAGQKADVVRRMAHEVEDAEQLLARFLPPKYPFPIDDARAKRGQAVFENTCAKCHGTYAKDADGLPIFQAPKFFAWEKIGTDFDRLSKQEGQFKELIRQNPLKDLIGLVEREPGYYAPRLEGIWSRFPYLHNGSVPSIAALLTRPVDRPKAFSLEDAGSKERFDPETLGLTVPARGSREERELLRRGEQGDRKVYWTGRVGQTNVGHEKYLDLETTQKRDVIEYLKTL